MHVDPRTLIVPGPTPTGETAAFWAACESEEFTIQHCAECGHWVFYPRALCPFCWNERLEWRRASGLGTVRSFTVVHKPGHPGWLAAVPYTVAIVSLAEGPTMLTALVDIDPAAVRVHLPVEVSFTRVGEFVLPFFSPRAETTGRRG